ncbi:hypothetical protein HDU76_011956, partial [Blyttiomyces sp. JEL0837]
APKKLTNNLTTSLPPINNKPTSTPKSTIPKLKTTEFLLVLFQLLNLKAQALTVLSLTVPPSVFWIISVMLIILFNVKKHTTQQPVTPLSSILLTTQPKVPLLPLPPNPLPLLSFKSKPPRRMPPTN